MRALFAIAIAGVCGCYTGHNWDQGPSGPAPGDRTDGFTVTWKLVDAAQPGDPQTRQALPCNTAGISNVRLDLLNNDTLERFVWKFDCSVGNGTTPEVTTGRYTVTVDALDAMDVSRSRDSWDTSNYDSNDLGLVIFEVNR
jgi:hypothetical protein